MKRARRFIESHLEALCRKKARLDEEVARLKRQIRLDQDELNVLDEDETVAREITVPSHVFERAAMKSRSAWKPYDFGDDVYQGHRLCQQPDTCWYRRNTDRLDGLGLYHLCTLDGDEWIYCDMCVRDDPEIDVSSQRRHGRSKDSLVVRVDPDEYEVDIAEYLRKAAQGDDDLSDIEIKSY